MGRMIRSVSETIRTSVSVRKICPGKDDGYSPRQSKGNDDDANFNDLDLVCERVFNRNSWFSSVM